MNIRPYELSDIESIGVLYDEFVRMNASVSYKHNSRDIYLNWLTNIYAAPSSTVSVVDKDSSLIGFAVGLIQPNKPLLLPDRVGHIGMVMIQSKYRRQGLGRFLYQHLLDWFRANEVSEIQLTTEADNVTAKKFWDSVGFVARYEQRSITL